MIYFLCVSDVRAVKLYLPAKQAELDAGTSEAWTMRLHWQSI